MPGKIAYICCTHRNAERRTRTQTHCASIENASTTNRVAPSEYDGFTGLSHFLRALRLIWRLAVCAPRKSSARLARDEIRNTELMRVDVHISLDDDEDADKFLVFLYEICPILMCVIIVRRLYMRDAGDP